MRVLFPEPPQPTIKIRGFGTPNPPMSSSSNAVEPFPIASFASEATMSFNDWSACLVVRVASGPIPYASEKNKAVHFTINRDAREPQSRAHFATLISLPFQSEELIYTRLVADIASLSSVGRAPGCSWKNPNVSADTRVSPVQVWERGPTNLYESRQFVRFTSRPLLNIG